MLLRFPFVISFVALLAATTSGNAATFLWVGGHSDNSWSRKQNWDDKLGPSLTPVGLQNLEFGGTNVSNNNDLTGALINDITFLAGAGAFNLSGNAIALAGDITNNSSNTQTISLNMVLGGSSQTFTTNASGNMIFSGILSSGGTITKAGAGTLTLTNSNTYTGSTTVSAGTLALSGSGLLADTVAVDVSGSSAIFDISAISAAGDTIGSIAGVAGASVVLGGKTLTAGGDNTSTTFAGVISGSGGGLTKSGTGKLTLTGTNTYTGTTTVNAGILQIDGIIASAVTVNSGATLSGSGSVTKAITINGLGALLPGNKTPSGSGIGTFTLSGSGANGDLSVASTGSLGLQLGANGISFANQSTTFYTSPGVLNANYGTSGIVTNATDRIVVGGTLTLSNGSVIDVTLDGYNPSIGDGFDILDWSTLTATPGLYTLNLPTIDSGLAWDTSLFATNGIIVVVPEPSRVILVMAGLITCLLRRRRKITALI